MTASRTNEDIKGKDIIQADAAIIAGILILLTISSFSPFEFPNRSMFGTISISVIILFSVSALTGIDKRLIVIKAEFILP